MKHPSRRDTPLRPTAERRKHDPIVRLGTPISDAEGNVGRPWQVEDTLLRMLKADSIDNPMYKAGLAFHAEFRRAGHDTLKASDPNRIPVQLNTAHAWQPTAGARLDAKRSVDDAISKLGGPQSPGGICAMDVLGLDITLTAWAASRRIHPQRASGILIAVLGVLREHYGL
jgi:hypothetical protein